jgi:hypothetical protein
LDRLESVRKEGGGYKALCPAHGDRNPSLGIKEGEDGRALVNCLAGCKTEDVVAAIGLSLSDLSPPPKG